MTDTTTPEQEAPQTIRAFDQNGQEVLVPRDHWATEVLPNMVKQAWNNPEQLYFVVVNSLNEGFLFEIAPAAQRLYESDPVPARGTCVWAATLIGLDRLVEAEMVLSTYLERHGDHGSVLVNLAKVFQAKGEDARAEATLHRALEVDPNEDNALGWLAGLAQRSVDPANQSEVEAAVQSAIEKVAAHPGAWRPQLWLARQALVSQDFDGARALYTQALANAPTPAPPELLTQMSGDLGNQSQTNPALLDDLIALTTPHFIPEVHGLQVGNNLIKANADRGHLDVAAALVQSLAALNQQEWAQPLAFWQSELARLSGNPGQVAVMPQAPGPDRPEPAAQQQVQIGMVRIDGPVWLPTGSPARSIFPAKPSTAPVVIFLGGSAESPVAGPDTSIQFTTALGVLTRALPLFLAEQTEMRTAAAGRTILPWAVGAPAAAANQQPSGFIVANQPWPDETAVQAATQSDPSQPADLVVTVHIDAEVNPWEVSLTFLRTADSTRIGELSAEFTPEAPTEALLTLTNEMAELLGVLGTPATTPLYTLPQNLPAYLSALDNLLTLRCATMPNAPIPTPEARAAILENATQLNTPSTQPTQILLTEIQTALNSLNKPAQSV